MNAARPRLAIVRAAAERALSAANKPAAADSLAAFRIAFGLIAFISVVRFFAHDWIDALYIQPRHHFGYFGFEWVRPLPGWGMQAHFAALALLSLSIAAGYRCRLSAALFFIGFTYAELIDKTTYLNHYYWMSLASLLMAFLPMGSAWSVDRLRAGAISRAAAPLWTIWALRAQVGAVYVFAGAAKLNPDWLLNAQPMRIWLYQRGDIPLIGPLLQETWAAYAFSWAGAAFDLTVVAWLLWRPSRPWAYAALVAFHIATWALFPRLGVFPWLMIGAALIFFDPDWPRRAFNRIARAIAPRRAAAVACETADGIARADACAERAAPPETPAAHPPVWARRLGFAALALFAAAQIALPLRHFAYPGNSRWNEEGYRFAWRVMLTEKVGFVQFRVHHEPSGRSWVASPRDYLTPLQVDRMSIMPDMIAQTARIIAADFAARGYPGASVKADAFASFNGRANQRLIDPDADLARAKPSLAPKAWALDFAPSDAAATAKQASPWNVARNP